MIMVDSGKQDCEWGYTNLDGDIESVHLSLYGGGGEVQIRHGLDKISCFYLSDVPNLIKALQAAYTYSQQEK